MYGRYVDVNMNANGLGMGMSMANMGDNLAMNVNTMGDPFGPGGLPPNLPVPTNSNPGVPGSTNLTPHPPLPSIHHQHHQHLQHPSNFATQAVGVTPYQYPPGFQGRGMSPSTVNVPNPPHNQAPPTQAQSQHHGYDTFTYDETNWQGRAQQTTQGVRDATVTGQHQGFAYPMASSAPETTYRAQSHHAHAGVHTGVGPHTATVGTRPAASTSNLGPDSNTATEVPARLEVRHHQHHQHHQHQPHSVIPGPSASQVNERLVGVTGFGMGFGNAFQDTGVTAPMNVPMTGWGHDQGSVIGFAPFDYWSGQAGAGSDTAWMEPTYDAYGIEMVSSDLMGFSQQGQQQQMFGAGEAPPVLGYQQQESDYVPSWTPFNGTSAAPPQTRAQEQEHPPTTSQRHSSDAQQTHLATTNREVIQQQPQLMMPPPPPLHPNSSEPSPTDSAFTHMTLIQRHQRRQSLNNTSSSSLSNALNPNTNSSPSEVQTPPATEPPTSTPGESTSASASVPAYVSTPTQPQPTRPRVNVPLGTDIPQPSPAELPPSSYPLGEQQFLHAQALSRREAAHALKCANEGVGGVCKREMPEEVREALRVKQEEEAGASPSGVARADDASGPDQGNATRRQGASVSPESPVETNRPRDASVGDYGPPGVAPVSEASVASGSQRPPYEYPSMPLPASNYTSSNQPVTHGPAFPARPPQPTAPNVSPNPNTEPPSKFLTGFPGLSHYVMPDGHVSYNIGDFAKEVYDGRSYIPDDPNVPQPPPGARCGDMVAQVHRPHPLAAHAYHMLINPTGPRDDIGFGIDGRPKGGANTGGRGGNGSGASQKKYTSDRKVPPKMACTFCRARKIACGLGNGTGEDKTCNQCLRRGQKCIFPTESRRGIRSRKKKLPEISTETVPQMDQGGGASTQETGTIRKGKGKARSEDEEEEEGDGDGDDDEDEGAEGGDDGETSGDPPTSLQMPPPPHFAQSSPTPPGQHFPSVPSPNPSPTSYTYPSPPAAAGVPNMASGCSGENLPFSFPPAQANPRVQPPSTIIGSAPIRRGPFTSSPLPKRQKRDDNNSYVGRK